MGTFLIVWTTMSVSSGYITSCGWKYPAEGMSLRRLAGMLSQIKKLQWAHSGGGRNLMPGCSLRRDILWVRIIWYFTERMQWPSDHWTYCYWKGVLAPEAGSKLGRRRAMYAIMNSLEDKGLYIIYVWNQVNIFEILGCLLVVQKVSEIIRNMSFHMDTTDFPA